jgi:L-threonylcarbamoyladenylate synthase
MDLALIAHAAGLIREGKLVAFPTETVYGLGANALDAVAVRKIFLAKGRPETSPLIVHVSSIEMARELAAEWPEAAEKLAAEFWPGPLTLVVLKSKQVPDEVTAGLPTVALRQPDHPLAAMLITQAGVPIAAPSANRFGSLSPTTAEHVIAGLGEAVDLVLDGGATRVGIESTVLSLAGPQPVLLRPGMITREEIEERIGPVEVAARGGSGPHASPGMHARHYSPRTPMVLNREGDYLPGGRVAYLWLYNPDESAAYAVEMPSTPAEYGATLYDTLFHLDAMGFDYLVVERPPDWPEWEGILDRLKRASA